MAKSSADKKKMWGSIVPGVFLVALGVIFLLNNYGITTINLGNLWPIFLIIPGIFMLMGWHHHHD